ncbi:sulfatase [Echinicola strongylocentroti]|uniref:Sulfatase n=1 Tax=Echinicola strongylocentroti TaxID=1795355 RepID=A0A2Z4IP39_9BACT|nr:sulfatase [Echinicola strongylocentroti]AWW32872.1 sulfatase [Echinicola strongylocentroti]
MLKVSFLRLGVVFAFLCLGCAKSKPVKKPNIIFILVDDLGYGDVGFNGSKYYETPNIDRLAGEGLIFDQSYMYPTCSPSRTAIFTGKQSFRTGVYTVPVLEKGTAQENIFSRWTVGKEHEIYAEVLAQQGYKSIHLGKWHIVGPYPEAELRMDWPIQHKLTQPDPGDFSWLEAHRKPFVQQFYPTGRGFLKNVGGTFRGDPALEKGGYHSYTGGYRAPFSNPFIAPKPDDEWLTDRLTDDAVAFMKENRSAPFFVNLHYYTVHRPIKSRNEKLFKYYMDKNGDPVTGQGMGKRKETMAAYATMISSLDENVGRLVDFLDEHGLRENTLIVFSSDNGYNGGQSSNHHLRGAKGEIYEGGIKVPTFFNWPGEVRPARTDRLLHAVDYFPTFLDLAGVPLNEKIDGKSVKPLFRSDTYESSEEALYWHLASQYKHGTCSAIRKGDYKLIQFLKDGEVELYDLANDPLETENVADQMHGKRQELVDELVEWRKSNKVPLPPNSTLEY